MSIFSGWEAGDWDRLKTALTGSPSGLVMLAVFVLVIILLMMLLVHLISSQISNFTIKISQEEDEEKQDSDNE